MPKTMRRRLLVAAALLPLLLACSASMVNRRIDREALAESVDDVVGWPTAISLIRSAERSFVW